MDTSTPSKVSLKLLIDKKATKVLFAEAGKEAVDFLCSILTLPMGTVVRLLFDQGMAGCLPNLYQSIESMNDDYIQPNQNKDAVLKPLICASFQSNSPVLQTLTDAPKKVNQFFRCSYCSNYGSVTNVSGSRCRSCSNPMTYAMTFVEGVAAEVVAGGGDGFVKGVVTYMVMDDLVVAPMSTITGITLLNKFNVTDVGALEERVVDLDMPKALKLLKTSLQSKNVLTKVFL